MRSSSLALSASESLPRVTAAVVERETRSRALLRRSSDGSLTIADSPERAATSAIPEPIRPPPTMPSAVISLISNSSCRPVQHQWSHAGGLTGKPSRRCLTSGCASLRQQRHDLCRAREPLSIGLLQVDCETRSTSMTAGAEQKPLSAGDQCAELIIPNGASSLCDGAHSIPRL